MGTYALPVIILMQTVRIKRKLPPAEKSFYRGVKKPVGGGLKRQLHKSNSDFVHLTGYDGYFILK